MHQIAKVSWRTVYCAINSNISTNMYISEKGILLSVKECVDGRSGLLACCYYF